MTAAFSLPDAPANDRARPLLVAERVTKSYGEVVGCRDVSLAIHPGEVLGIVGESGSGKTTLLKVLSARMAPNAGTVSFDAGGRGLADVYAMAEPARRAGPGARCPIRCASARAGPVPPWRRRRRARARRRRTRRCRHWGPCGRRGP